MALEDWLIHCKITTFPVLCILYCQVQVAQLFYKTDLQFRMNPRKKQASILQQSFWDIIVPVPVVLYNPSTDCSSHIQTNEKSVWHMPPAALFLMTNSAGMLLMNSHYLLTVTGPLEKYRLLSRWINFILYLIHNLIVTRMKLEKL